MVRGLSLAKIWTKISSLPKGYTVSAIIFFGCLAVYTIVFFTPKHVDFSYAMAPCVNQLTLFPTIHKSIDETLYEPRPASFITFGSFVMAAREMCFLPTQPPREGVTKVTTSPFGGWFMRKTFTISAESPPTIDRLAFDKPVPASRPLELPIEKTDRLFQYSLQVHKKAQVKCSAEDSILRCDVRKLKLTQGKPYNATIIRRFADIQAETSLEGKLTTLPATRVIGTSIKPAEVVYAKPKTVKIAFDKKITDINPVLYRIEDGGKRTSIETDIAIDRKSVQVKTAKDLPRSAKFELVVRTVQAADGSGLEDPYILAFETSGGPKVANISVGSASVPIGATATITFDQALSEEQDISKAVSASGGAVVSGRTDRQIHVSLADVPKCGDFTIKINNKLQSSYDVTGNSEWEFTGRIICHSVATIGASHQGRPINAYFFGDGSAPVVYTGAIHGSEISSRDLMYQWIDYLEANARNIPKDKTVVVIPQINPDGVATGSRANARNVDLNRNFATNDWQKDVTTVDNQPFPGGGGEKPMSEPETQAIATLIQQLRPALVLSYHSIGGLIIANQAGFSSSKAATYSQLSGYYNATGQSNPFEYSASGTADDWYAQKLGVPSLLIELGSHTYHQFDRNQSAMWAMLQ